jgi:hypothetical protein
MRLSALMAPTGDDAVVERDPRRRNGLSYLQLRPMTLVVR